MLRLSHLHEYLNISLEKIQRIQAGSSLSTPVLSPHYSNGYATQVVRTRATEGNYMWCKKKTKKKKQYATQRTVIFLHNVSSRRNFDKYLNYGRAVMQQDTWVVSTASVKPPHEVIWRSCRARHGRNTTIVTFSKYVQK